MMEYRDLDKREKKIIRAAIDKGVAAEFKAGLEKARAVIDEWEKGGLADKEGYHKLFKAITDHDKRISKRYDGLTGSSYLVTVAAILYDGQITDDELADLSEETKDTIYRWINFWKGTL